MNENKSVVPVSESLLALLGVQSGAPAPYSREIFLLDIAVAGTSQYPNKAELSAKIEEGTVLRLLRDPGDELDEMAIGVYLGEDRIGWVPIELNLILSRLMDAGKAFVCRVQKVLFRGDWLRIEARISMIE